jgi:hypothetical protein
MEQKQSKPRDREDPVPQMHAIHPQLLIDEISVRCAANCGMYGTQMDAVDAVHYAG